MKATVIGAAAAVLLVVGLLAFRTGGGSTSQPENPNPSAFDLPALDGPGRVRLDAFRGKPFVVNLFASWCAECAVELPAFARAATDLRGRVQFVGVNSMETGDGRRMANQYHLQASGFTLARDVHDGLHTALHVPGMPVTIFYAADGHQLQTDIASLSEAELRSELHRLYGV